MSLKWLALLGLGFWMEASAHELRQVAHGLQVQVEDLDGEIGFNGLPVTVSRVVGVDMPALAGRLIERWRGESGPESVRLLQCCGWTVASRIHRGESQVAQWRAGGPDAQLLWSTLVLATPIKSPPPLIAPLLGECRWSRPVHGRVAGSAFIQFSAHCALDPEPALELMIRRLKGEGWRCHRQGRFLVQATRGTVRTQLIAAAVPGASNRPAPGQSSLVLLESRLVAGRLP